MRRVSLAAPVMVVAGLFLCGCHWAPWRNSAETPRPVVGVVAENTIAPDIDAEDMTGQRLHLADYRGKVVVLQFWANW
jgi:hypothetical protein